jgi:hypothetical protein
MLEVCRLYVQDLPRAERTSIEHRAGERAEPALGFFNSRLDLRRIGHVAYQRGQMLGVLLCHSGKPVCVPGEHCNLLPLMGKPFCDGAPQARADTGNQHAALSTHLSIS